SATQLSCFISGHSLDGVTESGSSLGLCLGLENKDKTQKESNHLSPRLEWGPQSPAPVTAALNQFPMLQTCSDINKSNLGPSFLTASIKNPQLYPLKPCKGTASMTLGCLVKDYFPGPVTVTWYSDSLNMSTVNFPALGSELKVTTSQVTSWGKSAKNFTCHVTHPPSFNESRTILVRPVNITEPTLELLHSSCDPNAFHSTIQLYCFIYGHILNDVSVSWLMDDREITDTLAQTVLIKEEGKLASTCSKLNITEQQWMSESTFTCKVTSQGVDYLAHTRRCPDHEPRGVITYLIPPSPLDLYQNGAPKLTCLVVDLESEKNVNVTWNQEKKTPVSASQWYTKHHNNATTSITSILPVVAKDWIEGYGYQCIVDHPDFPKPIVRSITKTPGQRSAPEVYVFPPPEEESEDKRTLTCLIQNFFPEDISVQWLEDGKLISNSQHSTTTPLKSNGSNQGFFIFSRLEVAKTLWTQRKQFTCQVIHEALQKPRKLEKTISTSLGNTSLRPS
uniref:Immunoglobulin heavy constant epsilon n=1 Tax=Mus spicilegus TaxID=10103 RepID=A0A8C6GFP6_MUSSI